MNFCRAHFILYFLLIFRPLRQTISWEAQNSVSGSLRTLSVDGNSVISHITDVSQSTEDDVAWSSENSNTDDEDAFGDSPGPAPVSLLR